MPFKRLIEWIEEHIFIKVHKSELADRDYFADAEGNIIMSKRVIPVAQVDPQTGQVPQSSPSRNTVFLEQSGALTNTSPTITVPAGERWKVVQMLMTMQADVNVATRALNMDIQPGATNRAIVATTIDDIAGVSLTASQKGSFVFNDGCKDKYPFQDNGATGVQSAFTFLPYYLDEGDVMRAECTNMQAGDILALDVWYERVD